MSSVVLSGDTSGTVTLTVPAVAGTNTVTVPAGTGTVAVQGVSTNIVSGTAVASTSGTSIDFTGIPSWVKRITVMFDGTSTNGSTFQMVQVGSGSVTTTGYNFYGDNFQNGAGAGLSITSGFPLDGGNSTFILYGSVVLTLVSTNKWLCVAHGGGWNNAGAYYRSYTGGGDISLGGALDRVRITTLNGTDTFKAGSVNILYE